MQYLLCFTRVLLVAALAPLLFAADFTILTVSLPVAQLNQPFTQTLTTQGGVDPITWTLNGTLPNGLSFSPSGVLSGSAINIDVQNVSFTARDSTGKTSTANFDLATGNGDISITSRTLPQAFAGEAYTAQLQSSGGKPLYKYSLLGAPLAAGLTLDPTGSITGTPQFIGLEFISVRVIDEAGNSAATRIPTAVSRNGIRFANLTPAIGSIGKSYRERITIENAPSGFVVTPIAGNLPYGLTIDSGGNIAGTPLVGGVFRVTLSGRDRNFTGLAVTELTIIVSGGLIQFQTTTLSTARQNQPYSQTLLANGGAPPFRFSLSSSTLPAGLTLSAAGVISGTPTVGGTFPFTILITDAANQTATLAYTLQIDAAVGTPAISAITSAASYTAEGVVPGEVIVVFGSGLGPATLTTFTVAGSGIPTTLASTRVLFDGVPAPVLYTQAGQLSVVAPFALGSRATTSVVVEFNGKPSAAIVVPVLAAKPALFTVDGSGQGPGAILNEDGSINTRANPAAKPSIVILYLTGAGQMDPAGQDGQLASAISKLSQSVSATVGGETAEVLYAGNAPGLVQGVVQFNLRLSAATPSGPQPIVLQIGSATTRKTVSVWVQ